MTRPRLVAVPQTLNFLAPVVVDDLVRMGRRNDGGYVLSQDVAARIDTLLSFGVSDDWSFEADLLKLNPHLVIHAYDHTVSHSVFVDRWKEWLRRASHFDIDFRSLRHKYNLPFEYNKFFQGKVTHFRERVTQAKSENHDVTIREIFDRAADSSRIFVKMDIEGSEYSVIDEIMTYSDKIVGLAVEFHDIGPRRGAFVAGVNRIREVFDVTHLHANNYASAGEDGFPECIEVTFERRRTDASPRRRVRLPIELDQPNKKSLPDYVLQFDLAAEETRLAS